MRVRLLFAVLLAGPSAAFAAPPPPAIEIPKELTDPATFDRLSRSMQAMSKALLDLRVGEMQAAIEGRPATAADKNRTVRDLGIADDPQFEQNFTRQIANAGPALQQSMKALTAAMPAIMKSVADIGETMDRAIANMPDPTYPKR